MSFLIFLLDVKSKISAFWKLIPDSVKKILGVLLIAVAIFSLGYCQGEKRANIEISKYEKRLDELNAEKKKGQIQVNAKVDTKYVDRIKVVTKTVTQNREIIKEIPAQCVMTKGWVYSHNQQAQGLPIDPEKAKDNTPSSNDDIKVLDVIFQNYAIDKTKDARIKEWQDWYVLTKKNLESK